MRAVFLCWGLPDGRIRRSVAGIVLFGGEVTNDISHACLLDTFLLSNVRIDAWKARH